MAKAFKYRGANRTVEDVNRKAKQSGGSYDSWLLPEFTKFKAKEGENCIRILPATWSEEECEKWGDWWNVDVFLHRNIGPDKGTYLCSEKMQGKPCPVCAARQEAEDKEEQDALRYGWRGLCWIVDRDNEKAGPQLWDMPITIFREINTRSQDKKHGNILKIDDPEEGYDVLFNRTGSALNTDYTGVEVTRDPTPIHESEKTQNKWLTYIQENPLPAVLNFYDAAYIEKILFGRASSKHEDAEEEEESETPRRSSRRRSEPNDEAEEEETPRSRRRPQREEAEEEDPPSERDAPRSRRRPSREESEEESEPEEREAAPRSRARTRRPPEDEEEADAEPEDEKPRTRRASRREEPEDEAASDEADETEEPSTRARKGIERLKARRG